jgi:hypothetical protein
MRKSYRWALGIPLLCVIALLATSASAQETKKAKKATKPKAPKAAAKADESKLPAAVKKTLADKFPNATIDKIASEKENGVIVWDIEFREGKAKKETDITDDGTMIETTLVITKKSLPSAVRRPIDKASKGTRAIRTEKIEITHETKDGKVIKLERPLTHYAVEMKRGEETAEIVVDEKGKVVEEPKWKSEAPKAETETKPAKAKKPKSTKESSSAKAPE